MEMVYLYLASGLLGLAVVGPGLVSALGGRPPRRGARLVRAVARRFGSEIRSVPRLARGGPRLESTEVAVAGATVAVDLQKFDVGSTPGPRGTTYMTEWRVVVRGEYPLPAGPVFGSADSLHSLAGPSASAHLPASVEARSDGAWITVSMKIPGLTEAEVFEAVTQVGAVAGGDRFGFGALKSLAGARWIEAGGESHAVIPGAPAVRLRTRARDGHAFTAATVEVGAGQSNWFAVLAKDGRDHMAGSPPLALASGLAQALAETGVLILNCTDGVLEVEWPWLQLEPDQLLAAADKLAELARQSGSAYR